MARLQRAVWEGAVPLRILLSPLECRNYNDSFPYMILASRLSYLPFLLERVRDFFLDALINPNAASHEGWFSFEGVPLKWQYPIGLLFDLLAGRSPTVVGSPNDEYALARDSRNTSSKGDPWEITVHFSEWPTEQLIPLDVSGKLHQDVFVQSVKEADYLRNGTAKTVMLSSKEDSTALWESVQGNDLTTFAPLYHKFLNPQGGDRLRHVPIKLYIPQAPVQSDEQNEDEEQSQARGGLRVVQGLVSPLNPASKAPQTLGSALHVLIPRLFPSRTLAIHARPVLHGVVVPMSTRLEDLMEGAVFCDGFLHIAIVVMHFGDSAP